jgi:hypothetical protein
MAKTSTDYAAMRADLSKRTMKQLREIARADGICLGYDGATKRGTVDAIVGHRKYREYMKERGE